MNLIKPIDVCEDSQSTATHMITGGRGYPSEGGAGSGPPRLGAELCYLCPPP